MKQTYSIEELDCIRQELQSLILFCKKHDPRPLPRFFQFCHLIIKNINICEANAWSDIAELSQYILHDRNCAMEIHTGLPEYYILGKTNAETQKLNQEIHDHMVRIDKLITEF